MISVKIECSVKKMMFGSKIEILAKNRRFGQNWDIGKTRSFGQKSKFLVKTDFGKPFKF